MIISSGFQNRIISLLNGYQWEIITYLCDINGGFIQYSAGISIAKSIIMSLRFQTESLVYRGGIYGKSLLTIVISAAVSFNTWRGFHSRNHRAGPGSMIVGSRFQNRIISLSGGYPREIITYLGWQIWFHSIVGRDFICEIIGRKQ
jgi:hypothetical protein